MPPPSPSSPSRRRSPCLVLLNGPPGAGKSTLAEALAARHEGLRALDVDVVKHALPEWPEDPKAAGLRARELILDRAGSELADGRGVVIGQYLARPEFPIQLAQLAERSSARFVHVVLELPAERLEQRQRERRRAPTRAEQATNDALVDPAEAAQLIAAVEALTRDGLGRGQGSGHGVVRVDASGDLEQTLLRLEQELGLSR